MPFFLFSGTFQVVNYSPDGDSIRFMPKNPNLLTMLDNYRPDIFNKRGHVQLRIEGIDALETHYKSFNQPLTLAHEALDRLMDFTKIKNIQWNQTHQGACCIGWH